MKNVFKSVAGAVALLLNAGAWAETPRSPEELRKSKVNTLSAIDKDFIKEAARGGLTEVELGRLGVKNGTSTRVKQFAQQMIDDHTRVNQELEQVVMNLGFELKAGIDSENQRTIDTLAALKGSRFDAAYMKQMITKHEKTIALFKKQLEEGERKELKDFARKTLPTIEHHLKMARDLDLTKTSAL